jgi:hypothetical protein
MPLLWFVIWLGLTTAALSHEWISKQRNAMGEMCCGEGDCFMVQPVRVTDRGYFLPAYNEVVPFNETLPSLDGAYWRCKRPDGSRRCFFAPPPSM